PDYKCMKASAYKGSALQAESWLISPAIALNGKAATLSFEHASKFAKNNAQEMQLHYSVDGGATWTELAIPTYSPGEYQFVPSGSVELPAAQNVQIAFVYKSTSSNACTWEVKNVKVYQ
ncbi:MAG: choice-of-anchor J domain-containing protein, partial [Bacteroidaceae bacterium]|nr:choice-of-anchor J domain-containing protein [Bacteroidaceae bacterium]